MNIRKPATGRISRVAGALLFLCACGSDGSGLQTEETGVDASTGTKVGSDATLPNPGDPESTSSNTPGESSNTPDESSTTGPGDDSSSGPPLEDTSSSGGAESGSEDSTGEPQDVCSGPQPGPNNTGVPPGVSLVASGSLLVEEDGAVIEGLDITGEINVRANDVTIRNVRITSAGYYPIRYFEGSFTGLLVEDTEIIGTSAIVGQAIAFSNYTARRVNVHGMADGFKADANVLIEDCWVHDLFNGPGQHNDGVQSTGGADVTVRHNTIGDASSAAIHCGSTNAPIENLHIECNWLDDGGWMLNLRGQMSGTEIIDNVFGPNAAFGHMVIDDPNPLLSGNVDENGSPVTYP